MKIEKKKNKQIIIKYPEPIRSEPDCSGLLKLNSKLEFKNGIQIVRKNNRKHKMNQNKTRNGLFLLLVWVGLCSDSQVK